jgi:hypothetical protein
MPSSLDADPSSIGFAAQIGTSYRSMSMAE